MDIKELLEELKHKVKDPSFSELAARFRSVIQQSVGYTRDEKRQFYDAFKHLWDERKAWLENRKREQEHKADELDYLLDVVERIVETNEYSEQARLFEREFRRLGGTIGTKKEKLWERFQAIREKRAAYLVVRKDESGSICSEYEARIQGVNTDFGGAPELEENSHWDKIGTMFKASRDSLRDIRHTIENEHRLLRPEKKDLFDVIESVRNKITEIEKHTFEVHGKRAEELYNEAKETLALGNIGDAAGMLKNVQAQIRMLWLKRGEKDRYVSLTEELWGELKGKRKEKKQQFIDWLSKQKDGLDKLRAVKQKAEDALERIRKNIEENRERMNQAHSEEFAEKVTVWIAESEEKEKDILRSVDELTKKIADIEDKLKKHGMM